MILFHSLTFSSWGFIVQISEDKSFGKFDPLCDFCIVRSLVIAIVRNPPIIASVAKADCGMSLLNMLVTPIKGAVSSQTLAHTTVEKAQIFFFSAHTSSPVQVVNKDRVDEIATLDTIADTISNTTRLSSDTATIQIHYRIPILRCD